jgi:endonuclease/exonuclease/phosphatase family metal-dependent hydrolase
MNSRGQMHSDVRKAKPHEFRFLFTLVWGITFATAAGTFRVATYNVENYLDAPTQTRRAKPEEAKVGVKESILALHPDVICLEEIGSASALQELRDGLKARGLDFPFWEHVAGYDTNIHVAVLSRFPFTSAHSWTNEVYLLNGRRFHVSRGFAQIDVRVNPGYSFTLIGAHLKSKRIVPQADESEMRLEEAKILRQKIDAVLKVNPIVNLVVLGDFNDNRNSPAIRELVGKGRLKLVDTRPAERDGDAPVGEATAEPNRRIAWTHYYSFEDIYSRLDYILLSTGMAREWLPEDTFVFATPNWGAASDHRPIVATFVDEER